MVNGGRSSCGGEDNDEEADHGSARRSCDNDKEGGDAYNQRGGRLETGGEGDALRRRENAAANDLLIRSAMHGPK